MGGSVSKVRMFWFAVAALVLSTTVTFLVDVLKQYKVPPAVTVGVTLLGGLGAIALDLLKSPGERPRAVGRAPVPVPGVPPAPPPHRPGRLRGLGWALVVLLVLAATGYAAVLGVQWAAGWLTGNEKIRAERLVATAAGTAGPLRVEVTGVGVTRHYTKIRVRAVNTGDVPVTIHLFGGCQFVLAGGSTLKPASMPAAGDLEINVPAGSIPVTATITLSGNPPPEATTATLSLTGLFAPTVGMPQALQVKGVRLRAE
ncbi:hypothetical protein [Longispora albida]|uniref:hypothetical protein n=1 Tax=Longispora albida TaxID=203523 RepID=UPI000369C9B2|nr:hypothetical protein [Longispora albida]